MPNAKRPWYRKLFCALCAIAFAICLLFTAVSGLINLSILNEDRVVNAVVTKEYLAQIKTSAAARIALESPYYGIPEEVLEQGLREDLIEENASDAVRYALNAILGKSGYQGVSYPAEPFRNALEAYFDSLRKSGEQVELNEDALTQISEECAFLTEGYLNPIAENLVTSVFQNARVARLTKLVVTLGKYFRYGLAGTALTLTGLCFLSPKGMKEKLFWIAAPAFCASTILFVPTVFLLPKAGLEGLVLDQGVLRSFLEGAYATFVSSFTVGACLFFGISCALLIAAIVLKSIKPARE